MKYIDDILYIPVLEEGDKLYHYTSAAGLQGICEKQFWVTESNFLNDSSEFQIGTRVFCEMFEKHFSCKSSFDKFADKLKNAVYEIQSPSKLGEQIAYSGDYVISFCLDNDSILMWSEYSDFVGYCMKFDFQKLIDSFSDKRTLFHGAVIYDHDEQLECAEKSFTKFVIENEQDFEYMNSWEDINFLTDTQMDEIVLCLEVMCTAYNMFFKQECFKGEHEYRIVIPSYRVGKLCKPENIVEQHFRVKNEVLIPYIKQNISSLESLEAVTVGAKNTSDIAVKGLQYFFRNKKLNVEVHRSKIPLRY